PPAMPANLSPTPWLHHLRAGDVAAGLPLWGHYHARLVRTAHAQAGDAVLADLCTAAAAGRFPRLDDRDDLWRLLLPRALQRGHASAPPPSDLFDLPAADLDRLTSDEPDPNLAAAVAAELADWLALLPEALRPVARGLLEGYSLLEMARQLGCSVRS